MPARLTGVAAGDGSLTALEGEAAARAALRWLEEHRPFWLDLEAPDEAGWDLLQGGFGFHPLSIEDARSLSEFAKVDPYPEYLFVSLHRFVLDGTGSAAELRLAEVDLFLHPSYVVTVHLEPAPEVDEVWRRLVAHPELMRRGSEFVAHLVVDAIVDGLFPVIERLVEAREQLEDRVLALTGANPWSEITRLRRVLLTARRSLRPQAEALAHLGRERRELVSDAAALYFRDIADHADRLVAIVENELRLLDNVVQMYLSLRTDRLNVVMQRLTMISAIFMPLTLIAGIYGMNFRHMPELQWRWGYPFALGLMVGVGFGTYWYLKARGWFDPPERP